MEPTLYAGVGPETSLTLTPFYRIDSADPERTLIRGKAYDLPNSVANELIEADAARKIADKDIKPRHTPPSDVPREA